MVEEGERGWGEREGEREGGERERERERERENEQTLHGTISFSLLPQFLLWSMTQQAQLLFHICLPNNPFTCLTACGIVQCTYTYDVQVLCSSCCVPDKL